MSMPELESTERTVQRQEKEGGPSRQTSTHIWLGEAAQSWLTLGGEEEQYQEIKCEGLMSHLRRHAF